MQYGIAMRSASQFGSMLITTRSMNLQMYKTDYYIDWHFTVCSRTRHVLMNTMFRLEKLCLCSCGSDITDRRDKSKKHGDYSPLSSRTAQVQ